ncbi:MAG: histidinol-phosphate transaminase, partial [Gammaproteobacteria bacterium]|nr:histidinol-phosphate transaminase [Gammaproteobacteria bacterium]
YQPGKPIEELEREYGVSNIIKLASNENPLGPSPDLINVMRKELDNIGRYPDDSGYQLKQLLASKDGVTSEQITLGNGSCNVLELIIRTFVAPQHEVVFSQYSFAMYFILSQAVGAKLNIVPAKSWGHDLDAMRASVTDKTKLIFIANPNNPTGTWLQTSELREFVTSIPSNVLVVIDEAYFEYASYADSQENSLEKKYPNTIPWIANFPNLIVTRTFSKAYGLAGLRIGYGIAHPDVTNLMNRIRQPFNVNNLAVAAAKYALKDEAHLNKSLDLNANGLRQLSDGLQGLGYDVVPSAGNFVFVDIKQDAKSVNEYLLQNGIIVRSVENYGLPNHLRISVGLPEENRRLLETLQSMLV